MAGWTSHSPNFCEIRVSGETKLLSSRRNSLEGNHMRLYGPIYMVFVDSGLAGYDSVLNTHLVWSNVKFENGTVSCAVSETNRWLQAAGIESVSFDRVTFSLNENRIVGVNAKISVPSIRSIESIMESFMPWVLSKYPQEFAAIAPAGVFQYNAASGEAMVGFLKEWRKNEN